MVEPLKRSLMAPSGNDYRPLGHMPGYTAGTPIKKNYDEYTFPLENGSVPVRGAVYGVAWSEPAKAPEREIRAHEIPENDRQALDDLHAQILLDVRSNINQITARLEDQGKTIWLYVNRAMHMTQVEAGGSGVIAPTGLAAKTTTYRDAGKCDRTQQTAFGFDDLGGHGGVSSVGGVS